MPDRYLNPFEQPIRSRYSSSNTIRSEVNDLRQDVSNALSKVADDVDSVRAQIEGLTLDMIAPAFAISSFAIATNALETGQSIATPAFTAAYSTTPDTAANSVVLTDSEGSAELDVSATPTAFNSAETFVKTTPENSVTFTLTAKKGAITRVSTSAVYWYQRSYWGIGAAGGNTEAFIKALANNALANSRSKTFTVTAGSAEKIYYAYRTAYGAATFTVGGFEGGFDLVSDSISVTNAYGVTENYTLYESTNPNLGTTTVVVS